MALPTKEHPIIVAYGAKIFTLYPDTFVFQTLPLASY